MADDLAQRYSNLNLDDDRGGVVDLGEIDSIEPMENLELLLVGKLLTERPFNVEAFKRTMLKIWAPSKKLIIRVLGPNLFGFQFFHWRDKEKVFNGIPWCFDNALILLKEANEDEQPEQATFKTSPFWVRIKGLPFNCRSNDHVKAITKGLGDLLKVEDDLLGLDRYRRARVLIDVSKPLRRFQKIFDKKGKEVTVEFAYERLPFFCFACEIMGHSEKDCSMVTEEEKKKGLGWGTWLKASPRRGRAKDIEEMSELIASKRALFVTKQNDTPATKEKVQEIDTQIVTSHFDNAIKEVNLKIPLTVPTTEVQHQQKLPLNNTGGFVIGQYDPNLENKKGKKDRKGSKTTRPIHVENSTGRNPSSRKRNLSPDDMESVENESVSSKKSKQNFHDSTDYIMAAVVGEDQPRQSL